MYSGERDESYEGRKRILLNQSDLGALHRELAAVLEPSWANFIVAYRQYGPYSGSEAGTDASSLVVDLSKPPQHNIQSPLELLAVRVAIPTGDQNKKQIFASPFTDDPGQMRDYLPKLMDQVTVRSGTPIVGRVNINLAEREVLAAIPGFDSALSERIISARTLVAAGRPRSTSCRVAVDRRGGGPPADAAARALGDHGGRRRTCSDYRLLRPAQPVHAV